MIRVPHAAALLSAGAACAGTQSHDGSRHDVGGSAGVVATWEADRVVPLVYHVRWATEDATRGRVAWLAEAAAEWAVSEWEDASTSDHATSMIGIEPGQRILAHPEWETAGGTVVAGADFVIDVPALPPEMPVLSLNVDDGARDGFLLTHFLTLDHDSVAVLDRDGVPVWYTLPTTPGRILGADLSADGESVWFIEHAVTLADTTGYVYDVAVDGSRVSITPLDAAHSDVAELPEGGFGWLKKVYGDYAGGVLLWDEIWEHEEGGGDRLVFSLRDWFEPEMFCACVYDRIFFDQPEDVQWYDWTHANSLRLSDDGSAWYMMVRYFDAIMKIDRATGELLWVMGGPYNEFEFDGTVFNHAHMSQIHDGWVLVFDNGTHRQPNVSRVVEYTFDEDVRTARLEWEYLEPSGAYIEFLGDAQRQTDGDTVVSWSTRGIVQEVDADRKVRWEVGTSAGTLTGRVDVVDSLAGD